MCLCVCDRRGNDVRGKRKGGLEVKERQMEL